MDTSHCVVQIQRKRFVSGSAGAEASAGACHTDADGCLCWAAADEQAIGHARAWQEWETATVLLECDGFEMLLEPGQQVIAEHNIIMAEPGWPEVAREPIVALTSWSNVLPTDVEVHHADDSTGAQLVVEIFKGGKPIGNH